MYYRLKQQKRKDKKYFDLNKKRPKDPVGGGLLPYGHGQPFPFKVGDMFYNPSQHGGPLTVVLDTPTQGVVTGGSNSTAGFSCVCWIFNAVTHKGGKTTYSKKRIWHTDIEKMALFSSADKRELKAYSVKNEAGCAMVFSFSRQEAASALRNKTGISVSEDDFLESEIKSDTVVF